jgi:charged multivesicular body protein 6
MGASSSASRSRRAKKPDGRVTEVDRQVLGLKTQRRKLSAYAARVATQIARETANAKALAKSGDKARCLHALRRRKLHEQNANRIDEWAMSVETLLSSIEQAQATAVVLKRLKEGNEALREAQAGYGVEDVHETLREMEAGAEREAEINAMLADQLDQNAEDAALAELAELERAANDVSETTEDAATTNEKTKTRKRRRKGPTARRSKRSRRRCRRRRARWRKKKRRRKNQENRPRRAFASRRRDVVWYLDSGVFFCAASSSCALLHSRVRLERVGGRARGGVWANGRTSAGKEKTKKNGPSARFAARAKKNSPASNSPDVSRQPRTCSRVPSSARETRFSRPSQLGWRQSFAVARRTRSRRVTPRDLRRG